MWNYDALYAVCAINGRKQFNSSYGLLVNDCKFQIAKLHNVKISFTRLSTNHLARIIGRASGSMSGPYVQEIIPSEFIIHELHFASN